MKYTDKKGIEHPIFISYSNVKCYNKIRAFITERIAGINEIISNFEFTAKWMRPEVGGWIVLLTAVQLTQVYSKIIIWMSCQMNIEVLQLL